MLLCVSQFRSRGLSLASMGEHESTQQATATALDVPPCLTQLIRLLLDVLRD